MGECTTRERLIRRRVWRLRTSRRTNCGTGGGAVSRLIARAFHTNPSAVRAVLAKHGVVQSSARRRSVRRLTVEEREEVTRGIAAGLSSRAIASRIGRSPSKVSREIAKNGGHARYQAACDRARRPKATVPRERGRPTAVLAPRSRRHRRPHKHRPHRVLDWVSSAELFTPARLARSQRRELGLPALADLLPAGWRAGQFGP